MSDKKQTIYDTSIIRPQMNERDFKIRGNEMSPERLKSIKEGLLTLHALELMALTIYKFQITEKPTEANRRLIAAMCSEMTHYQDYQVKLYEFGFKPSFLCWAYLLTGFFLGYGSRLVGRKALLKMGIWAEGKAVNHYNELLETIDWDDDTREIIEKNLADENEHIARWTDELKKISP